MIFKSEFSVENKAKEFSFFDYFYRFVFPRKMLGSGKKKRAVGESGCRLSWRWKT